MPTPCSAATPTPTRLFEHLLSFRNDLGLLAEEYDPRARRQLGNFPQAFSHVALINTANNLISHRGPAKQRAERDCVLMRAADYVASLSSRSRASARCSGRRWLPTAVSAAAITEASSVKPSGPSRSGIMSAGRTK